MLKFRRNLALVLLCLMALVVSPWGVSGSLASSPSGSTLNGHAVMVDDQGKIMPWNTDADTAYAQVLATAWDYLLHDVPLGPSGIPLYRTESYLNPDTQRGAGWPSNPAGMNAMFIESALAYYAYSGNQEVLSFATGAADFHLDHGLTAPTDSWASVPYASGDAGSTTYHGASVGDSTGSGDGTGILEPDKTGELGYQLLRLYEVTGITRYRDAAVTIGDQLASHVRTGTASQSPWPFRTSAATNTIREQYTADVIGPISLLDELIRLEVGSVGSYTSARAIAWTWLMTYPMENNVWTQYFEDVAIQSDYRSNLTQYIPMMTARYLLLHPELDPAWESHVRRLIAWVETNFGSAAFGATTMREQNAFNHAMGSHTSRYASVNALLFERTGDLAAREKAYRAYNWATYMARANGVVIDGPTVNNQWFTDGYGDYIRHFLVGFGAVPAWAPSGENHLLRTGSAVQSVTYAANRVDYTTFEGVGIDTATLAAAPAAVSANGLPLAPVGDLATGSGYTYDAGTGVVRVRHDGATRVTLTTSGTPANVPPTVSLTAPATGAALTAPATVNLTATAADSDGTVTKVDFLTGATVRGTDTTAPYAATWTAVAAGSYALTARATDNSGATTTSSPVTITVTGTSSLPTGWSHTDVGAVGVAGDATSANGVFTVKGSGVDIWDASDSFHFVYLPLTGDGSITARVASQQNTEPWALAGVMVRETLAASSRHALAALTPSFGFSFTRRTTAGATSSYTSGGAGTVPGGAWVRVSRAGSVLTGYRSTNGATWTSMGAVTLTSLAPNVYLGLAVTSHVNTTLATDTFDAVTTTGGGSTTDTTPPVISGVTSTTPSQTAGTITWTTDEPADSQVDYGTTTSYGTSTPRDTTLSTSHSLQITGLAAGTPYHYRVRSADAAGNQAISGDRTLTTAAAPDTQAPTSPTGLAAPLVEPTQVALTWTAATDNTAVTGYEVGRNGVSIGTTTATTFVDHAVSPSTAYSYAVTARDAAGNVSPPSAPITLTTPGVTPPGTAALAVDTQVVRHGTTAATSISSPAITTSAPNELLVAFLSSNGPAAGGSSSFIAVTGGNLTWTLRKRANAQAGTSEIWTASAPARVNAAVVRATRSGQYFSSIVVVAFAGASLTTVGATGGASASNGAPSVSLTSTRAGSWVWAVGNDWDGALARTVGAGQTKVAEHLVSVGDTLWVQRRTVPTPAAGTLVTINDTAPTNHRWNLALLEVLPAG